MDFRKVYCAYHPTQHITNFCSEKQCLLPLCPVCISGHTQFHIQKGNFPRFQSIGQSLKKAEDSIEQQCQTFYSYKTRLLELVSRKENLSKEIASKLQETKMNIISQVNDLFEQLTRETLNSVAAKQKQVGLYTNQKICQIYELVNKEYNSLNEIKPQIRGDKYLTYLIRYFGQQEDAKNKFSKNMQRQIKFNQQYKASVQIDQKLINDLQSFIKKGARIKYVLPTELLSIKAQAHPKQEPIIYRQNSLAETKPNIIINRQPILTRQQSVQQIPNRLSVDQHRVLPSRFVQPQNIPIMRPSSSYSKQSTPLRLNSHQNLRHTIIPSSNFKQNSLFLATNSKMSENSVKPRQRKGLNLYKTLNQNSFK